MEITVNYSLFSIVKETTKRERRKVTQFMERNLSTRGENLMKRCSWIFDEIENLIVAGNWIPFDNNAIDDTTTRQLHNRHGAAVNPL